MGAQPSTRTNGPQPMDLGTFTASANYTQANSQRRGNPNNNKNKGKSTFYSNTPRPSSSGDWKKNATCHYCGKRGHIKPDCNQLRRDNNPTTVKGGAYGKPAATKGKLSLATEVAELRAELAALRA